MKIKKIFEFLIEDYGLAYEYQEFYNCYGGNWLVKTHSFYNDTGCFTIHYLEQRGELDFYYASKVSNVREELCEHMIDIRKTEPEIWSRYTKIGIFNRPFFWWNEDRVLNVLVEVLKVHISKQGEFYGIKLSDYTE